MKLIELRPIMNPDQRISVVYNKLKKDGSIEKWEICRGTWSRFEEAVSKADQNKKDFFKYAEIIGLSPVDKVDGLHLEIYLDDCRPIRTE